jgi:hypothetical protein
MHNPALNMGHAGHSQSCRLPPTPSEIDFVIEAVLKSKGYVLARICASTDFSLTLSATLGGVPIRPVLQQPRALNQSGQPRHDLFAFVLQSSSDIAQFKPNTTVLLRP